MKKPFFVRDAKSFYASIKNNPLYQELDDAEVIQILEQEFRFRVEAGEKRLTGWKLKEFLFWQGAQLGCLLMAKIFKHHIVAQAGEAGINPETGEHYAIKDAH
jgi:hypothetical protein